VYDYPPPEGQEAVHGLRLDAPDAPGGELIQQELRIWVAGTKARDYLEEKFKDLLS